MKKVLVAFAISWSLGMLGAAHAQAPAPDAQPPAATPAPAPATAPVMITDADIKSLSGPKAEDKANGDPGGTITGTVGDIPVGDAKKGLTIGDVVNQVGQNMIAINFVWTLVAGFLVMFMQAGFAAVETGLCRAKNANHTMMMNFMVYGAGMLAYWLIGFAIQEGGVGAVSNLGGTAPLNGEFALHIFGKDWGLFGMKGMMLGGATYDVGVMVMFLFQMVFMDTALTIVTGTAAERWKYSAFLVSSVIMGAFIYPLFGNWAGEGAGWRHSVRTTVSGTATRISPGLASFTRLAASPRWRWASSSGLGSENTHETGRPIRFRATTSRWCCSAVSFSRLAGSASIPVRRWARRRTATFASARWPSIPCSQVWPVRSVRCSTCGSVTASRMRR